MFPKVGKDAGFLTLFLEPLQRPFEALVIVDDDFWHSLAHPSQPGKGRNPNGLEFIRGLWREQAFDPAERENVRNVGDVRNRAAGEVAEGKVRNVSLRMRRTRTVRR
jgi:hypothetical protein